MPDPKEIIPFNRPFIIGREIEYITKAVGSGHLAANGHFASQCRDFFAKHYGVENNVLTTSCTSALELAALLLNIQPGDEIIAPSFAFVSTVNPFVLRGAKIVFADSSDNHPNINVDSLEALITPQTRAIVCVHYAGMACDMAKLMEISWRTRIPVIEDAAHAIESKWNGTQQLGTIGKMGCFSFHETKNIIAGEGGLLCINDKTLAARAELISNKGTNRGAFFRGETAKYEWVSEGSSFIPSELTSAYLFAQLEEKDKIQNDRMRSWNQYHHELEALERKNLVARPFIPSYAMSNGHIYYLVCKSAGERDQLMAFLKKENVNAVFHYQSLHKSPFYSGKHDGRELPNADRLSECLLRLPLFYGIKESQISRICKVIQVFYLQ
ncbi:MAG: dTDP-4-amino-4,6-dideoxygalactose transaminase [Bacteroidota bacterium]|nr:dTDP-4-amino-4,6-dideoxygalactose transaminase [Bacteroidota bacterium]